MAGPYSERQELEDLRKLKRLEELEAKAAGRSVSAPPQAAPTAPASPFLQRATGMLPEGTQPVFPAGAQASAPNQNILPGMGGGNMGTPTARPAYMGDAGVIERQRLADMARNAAQGAQDARLAPVKEAGKTAAGAAMSDFSARFETPKPNLLQSWLASGPQEMGVNRPVESAGIAAEREVFNKAGVMMPDVAAGSRLINSAALGLPAILNKDFRDTVVQAEEDQPGMALFGDVLGFAAPGAMIETGLRGVAKAAQPLITRVMPKGGSNVARTARVTGRTVGLAGSGATQSGIYQGTVGESIAAGKEDRAPSLAGAAEGFKTGATDPVALFALPAALVANRIGTYIRSGGATATPASVGQEISQLTGGRVAAPNAPQSAAAQVLDMGLAEAGIRSQAVDRVIRSFERAGMSREDITGLFQSVQQRLSGLPEAEAGRLTLGQALLEALENPELSRAAGSFPQAAMQLRQILRNASQGGPIGDVPRQGDQRAGIVSGVRRELQGSQTNFAQDAIDNALGNASLISIDDLISGAKREIGSAYEEVLRAADPNRPEARGIAMIVMGDASSPGILKRRAENAGFESVEAYVAARPDEAGHWVRSALAKAGRSAKGREKIELDTTVAQLDELLETNAGYAEARRAYGTEMGVEDATEFGNRFIASSKNEYSVDLLMRELEGMSDRERAVALASIRNNLRSYLRGSQEEASAKISQLTNVGALNALERLGPEGVQVADTLRFLRREQGFLGNVMYGSDTARNLSAGKAEALGNTGLQNVTSGQGGLTPAMIADAAASTVLGGPTAIFTPMRVAGAGIKNLFAPRVATLNDEVRFLMGRRGNIPDLPQSGTADFSAPPPQGGTPPQAPRTVGVAPAAAGAPVSPAGAPVPAPPPTSSPLATEWQQVMPQIGAARQVASDLRDAAATARSPDQIADVQTQLMLLRQQLQEVVTARGAGQTAEDLRLQEIVDALSVGGQDPRYLSALADEVANDLNAITQALNPVRTVGVPLPPVRGAGFALGPDTTNALAGGTLGGIAPAESDEERLRNIAIGTGLGAGARRGSQMLDDATRTVGRPRPPGGTAPGGTAPSGRTVGQGGYFGRQSLRPPGSGPSAREIETQQQWATATPIVTQARTTAQSAQQAADAALQSKAPADIARAKDQKKALVGQLQEAQASRAGMDTPEDARLAETLASLAENTSDPVLLSTQISAAKTSLDRLLTDIGSPVEGNLIPVRTNILTRTQAPRSAAEPAPERPSVTRYAEGGDEIKPQGFGAGGPEGPKQGAQAINDEYFNLLKQGKRREALRLLHKERGVTLVDSRIDRGGMHSPPSASDGAPGYDVASNGIFPDDLYSANGRRYYGTGDDTIDGPAFDVIKSMEANPNKMITIYRSVEKGASGKINPGDWVTTVRKYAKDHGEANIGSDFKIIKKTVAARDIFTDGNSVAEWGYSPQPRLPSHRGAYTEDLKRIPGEWKPIYAPDDNIKGMGFGASTPKTPQQAARFETPGSPEYEAAVAKGLDMSQAGRMARAKEMGFDTDTVLYHGTDATFDEFRPNDLGMIWLTSDAAHASNFGKVSPYYVSFPKGKYITTGQMDLNDPNSVMKAFKEGGFSDETAEDAVDVFKRGGINSENLLADLIKNGMPQKNTWRIKGWEGKGEVVVTTDPSNIRSVNAAFDPDKATSSTLLAAAPFAAVGGAGLTLAGEDARNQRTVGKPKASQSARTVGKAKTN